MTIALFATAAALSVICIMAGIPMVWMWGIWTVCAAAAAYLARSRLIRIVSFNIGAIAAVLAITEIVLGLSSGSDRQQWFEPPAFVVTEPTLGHRARPDNQVRARLKVDGELVYDVVYTIDSHGLRISPPEHDGMPASCALFFGDSFTFGEGVADDEAMPYVAGVATGGRYRTRNFGFLGYGPHHMLAALESGWVADAARCEPKVAVYWGMLHHVMRAAGAWTWDDKGPRYVLQPDGTVKRDGNFGRRDGLLDDASKVSRLANRFTNTLSLQVEDLELYFAIIRAARDRLKSMYPGIELHVLLWDTGDEPEAFMKPWSREGFTLHRISQILPEWGNRDWLYLQPRDNHPNAAADALLGKYVAEHILVR